jgi:hypothetical protein
MTKIQEKFLFNIKDEIAYAQAHYSGNVKDATIAMFSKLRVGDHYTIGGNGHDIKYQITMIENGDVYGIIKSMRKWY